MKNLVLPSVFAAHLGLAFVCCPPDDEHPSLASRVLATHAPAEVEMRSPEVMARAALAFLGSLDDDLLSRCLLPLDSDARREWTNLPPGAEEDGVRLGDLDERQLELCCDLLATVLSPAGYAKARDIMLADDRLLRNGEPRVGFGAENFWLLLFGTPAAGETWALQLDGHHLGLNLTFDGEQVCMSPSFIGTQPSAYERDGTEVVPMRGEVDDAFQLVQALSEEQRAATVVSDRRGRIVAGPGRDGQIPEPDGLACSELDERQRAILTELLRHFVGQLPEAQAERRMEALEAEIDSMTFAWSGSTATASDVSYRIQGPTVIVEYACQDLGGNPLDHLHAMYRDPQNEYGAAHPR